MAYEIGFSHRAAKAFASLERDQQERLAPKIDALAIDPRPRGCEKLEGADKNAYRIRVGDFRVLYTIDDELEFLEVIRVAHRRDVYRGL